jgi:hypothetical protein
MYEQARRMKTRRRRKAVDRLRLDWFFNFFLVVFVFVKLPLDLSLISHHSFYVVIGNSIFEY